MKRLWTNFLEWFTRRGLAYSVRVFALTLFLLVMGGYGLYQTKDLIFGTTLNILSPINGATVADNHLRIVGSAPRASAIYIDGDKVLPDQKGSFVWEYILATGLNVFYIETKDRFGRKQWRELSVVYQEPSDK